MTGSTDSYDDVVARLDAQPASLHVVRAVDFIAMDIPPRTYIVRPWLPKQGLVMIYGQRGVGKTYFGLGLAHAIASGSDFMRWEIPEPAGVLYVDGEMAAADLQMRLALIIKSTKRIPTAHLDLFTPDLNKETGVPDIATIEGQRRLDEVVTDDHKLIVIDNLSCLSRSGAENEGESWLPVQDWALRHRAAGRSVMFLHHAGKSGSQRGTSRREDVLDTVIALRRPEGYAEEEGARFAVKFEKSRGASGGAVGGFEARLEITGGDLVWHISNGRRIDFATMIHEGASMTEICTRCKISKSTFYRWRGKL